MKQELDGLNLPFMAKSAGPPWLPEPAAEARWIAWWTQWIMGLLGFIFIISGIISFFTADFLFWAGYTLVSGLLYFAVLYFLKKYFFDYLDQGKFQIASNWLLIFAIIGLFLLFVPGVLLLISYIQLRGVFQPNYQPYPAGTYQAGTREQASQPAAPQTPPPQQAPPPPPPQPAEQPQPEQPKKAEMVKCKKCGVQYPSFMRTCPNCNEPR